MYRTGMFVLSITIFLTGCATRGNVELLETRLREQENQLYSANHDLQQKDRELKSVQREVQALQAELGSNTRTASYPEGIHRVAQAEGIKFNKLRTGGLNEDELEGDDVISAVLTPYDASDDLVKLPGQVEFRLYDLSQPKGNQKLGSWKYSPEEVSEHWHKTFLTSGYLFKLPWQEIPTNQELTLVARFTTPDGRSFQANQIVRVDLPESSGVISQASYESPKPKQLSGNSLLPVQNSPIARSDNISRTSNRIDSELELELTPSDESDSKMEFKQPIPTSSSLEKYDNMKYQ